MAILTGSPYSRMNFNIEPDEAMKMNILLNARIKNPSFRPMSNVKLTSGVDGLENTGTMIGSGGYDTEDWLNTANTPAVNFSKYAVGASSKGAGLRGAFSGLRGKLSGLNNISLRNMLKNGVGDPELLGWSPKSGVSLLGGNIGNLYVGGKGLADTFNYLNNTNQMTRANQEGKDIQSEILASAASNPLASQYLTSDEIRMLNQIKRGSYSPEGTNVGDDMGAIGMGALKGGLSGLVMGGVPGAVLGAIGSGANAGIKSRQNARENSNARLEALLQSLNDASAQYKSMRRPNFTGLGIQSRFQDFYR